MDRGEVPPPKKKKKKKRKLGNLDYFGQQKQFGQSQFLKKFARVCVLLWLFFFFEEGYFLFQTEVCVVKPVKSTRDSSCLARDEFLAVLKGAHIQIYMYMFGIVLLLGTACSKEMKDALKN